MTDTQSKRIHAIVYSNDSREELAERIVALEDGYGSMSREHSLDLTELSDAYYEIDRLKAENEKLREQIYLLKKGDVLHVLTDQELADQQRHEREMQASIAALEDENERLRELVWDMYCLAYPSTVEWEVSDAVYDKYSPCEKCHELHGGKSPCASTSKDMTEECCEPIQAAVVADRMRELGIEVK